MSDERLTEEEIRQTFSSDDDPLQGFDMVIRGLGFECSSFLVDLDKSTLIVEAGLTPDMIKNKLLDKCSSTLMIGYRFEQDSEFEPFMLIELDDKGLKLEVVSISSGRYITAVKLVGKIRLHRLV